MRKLIFIIPLALLLLVGGLGFFVVFGPNTALYDGKRGVKIPRGSGLKAAADSLQSSGILGTRATFELLAKTTGWGGQIKAGYYEFAAGTSNYKMLDVIRKGLQTPIKLTIPPGTRPDVVASVAGKVMEFEAEDFARALADSSLARELGTDTRHLFGYLLPETYSFYWMTDAPTIIKKIKQDFDAFYDRELKSGAERLQLTPADVVTLASIVEWETDIPEEKPLVSGVYVNRLRIGMPLQADPTVQFAVIDREGQKRRLTFQDYRIDSPYNTYRYPGLPPSPINNPSPSSLRAAINPAGHDYLYFVAKGDGSHTFSRTFHEHVAAARQYRALLQERAQQQPAGN